MKRIFCLLIAMAFMFAACDTEVCTQDLLTDDNYCAINGTGACQILTQTTQGPMLFCYEDAVDADLICSAISEMLNLNGTVYEQEYDAFGACAPSASEPCTFSGFDGFCSP